ncbi:MULTISPECIES: alpha/beta hydrolase family esterase [Nocardia]|uniref:alpha/beta hydrolase family esterase n=1 Tax=Nocardia TaxID=1817 RepID=UPI000D68E01B|nr:MULTISPECIES: hypothetical protein [Nocardia]
MFEFLSTDRNRRSRLMRRLIGSAAAVASLTAAVSAVETTAQAAPTALASSGCSAPAPAEGESTLEFAAAGKAGTYIRDIPPATGAPLPVVLDLHGLMEPAFIERSSTALSELGKSRGFVTITPQLSELRIPQWDFTENSADITFLSTLLTHVEETLCVDRQRIYATGLSMGGFTSSSLGCQLSDRIAAIAPVAGLQDFTWCHTVRPVPVIAFHGSDDPIIAYTGGEGPNAQFLPTPSKTGSSGNSKPGVNGPNNRSIPDNAAGWARRNGCKPEPAQRSVAPDVNLQSYDCPADATVQLYTVLGAGHVWPGSPSDTSPVPLVGENTKSIVASELIWDFFQAHPLRR